MVNVIIEKDGDHDYEHFNGLIEESFLPKIGENIELFYPDGYCLEIRKVLYIRKVFDINSKYYYKIIVSN